MATDKPTTSAEVEPSVETDQKVMPTGADELAVDIVNAAEQHEYTDEQFRKLRWKIDRVLLPIMWVCFSPLRPAQCWEDVHN